MIEVDREQQQTRLKTYTQSCSARNDDDSDDPKTPIFYNFLKITAWFIALKFLKTFEELAACFKKGNL